MSKNQHSAHSGDKKTQLCLRTRIIPLSGIIMAGTKLSSNLQSQNVREQTPSASLLLEFRRLAGEENSPTRGAVKRRNALFCRNLFGRKYLARR
jgi:hypothetical protein